MLVRFGLSFPLGLSGIRMSMLVESKPRFFFLSLPADPVEDFGLNKGADNNAHHEAKNLRTYMCTSRLDGCLATRPPFQGLFRAPVCLAFCPCSSYNPKRWCSPRDSKIGPGNNAVLVRMMRSPAEIAVHTPSSAVLSATLYQPPLGPGFWRRARPSNVTA